MATKEFPTPCTLLIVIVAAQLVVGVTTKITTSLTNDILAPIIGGIDFHQLMIGIGQLDEGGEPVAIRYGQFITTVFGVDFSFGIALLILGMFLRIAWRHIAKIVDAPPAKSPKSPNSTAPD